MQLWNFLKRLNQWFWSGLKWLVGLGKTPPKIPSWVYQAIHFFFIALITVLLAIFSRDIIGDPNLSGSWPLRDKVNQTYLGILFFLGYLTIRLIIFVVKLFMMREDSEYPEIDAAWAAGMTGLVKGGLDLHSLPVFLITGLTAEQEPFFFSGVRFSADVVAPGPDDKSMPLRFYANRDAIFIVCHGVSAVCRQLGVAPVSHSSSSNASGGHGNAMATLQPGQNAGSGGTIQPVQSAASEMTIQPGQNLGAGGTLQPGQNAQTLKPGAAAQASSSTASERILPNLSERELYESKRRMQYFCRLISQARMPFCPINGMLQMVPLEWSRRSDEGCFASVAQDVRVVHEKLQFMLPVVCLFSGLNSLGAIQEFIERSRQVNARFGPHARAGSRFPMGHAVDPPAVNWVVENGVEWFRRWIYSAFAKGLANPSNTKLYRMLCELSAMQPQLRKLIISAFGGTIHGDVIRLSGCYYGGFDSASRGFVFAKDIIDKMVNEQDDVAWTYNRVRKDSQLRNWSYVLYLAIAILVLANGWLIWDLMNK